MYESPLKKLYGDIESEIIKNDEDNFMLAVKQAVGYSVDKDELEKALKYDRDQYKKGYMDAINDIKELIEGISISPGGDLYTRKMAELYSLKAMAIDLIDRCITNRYISGEGSNE